MRTFVGVPLGGVLKWATHSQIPERSGQRDTAADDDVADTSLKMWSQLTEP